MVCDLELYVYFLLGGPVPNLVRGHKGGTLALMYIIQQFYVYILTN